jgi:hypothetical protein
LKAVIVLLMAVSFVKAQDSQKPTRTQAHIDWPGWEWAMVPPEGFVPAPEINGFKLGETNYTIRHMAAPVSREKMLEDMKATPVPEGDSLEIINTFPFHGKTATLIKTKNTNPANPAEVAFTAVLLVGDESQVSMFMGVVPGDREDLLDQLIAGFQGMVPTENTAASLSAEEVTAMTKRMGFTIDATPLIYATSLMEQLVFTETGKSHAEGGDNGAASLMIGPYPIPVERSEWETTAQQRLSRGGAQVEKMDHPDYLIYESVLVKAEQTQLSALIFTDQKVFMVNSSIKEDQEAWLKKVRSAIQSFKLTK